MTTVLFDSTFLRLRNYLKAKSEEKKLKKQKKKTKTVLLLFF
jgi:hypothetical protein